MAVDACARVAQLVVAQRRQQQADALIRIVGNQCSRCRLRFRRRGRRHGCRATRSDFGVTPRCARYRATRIGIDSARSARYKRKREASDTGRGQHRCAG